MKTIKTVVKSLNTLVKATLVIEKLRVASEVRQSHLLLQGKIDPETDELHKRLVDFEEYVDGRIAELLEDHPAYPWFSRVKGIGRENIGKIVGLVRIAPGDEFVCPNKECPNRSLPKNGATEPPLCPKCSTQMYDPPYADTISALWKFCGYAPVDGKTEKRQSGEKLDYNSQLRSMCWRVGGSLMKAGGKFYEYYLAQKQMYQERYLAAGVKIVPAAQLPKVNGKKTETAEFISEGHIHNLALRKMIKLFLACLWLEWRRGERLPVTKPYAIDQLKHSSFIKPEEMVDR